jgi:hypothetical protein
MESWSAFTSGGTIFVVIAAGFCFSLIILVNNTIVSRIPQIKNVMRYDTFLFVFCPPLISAAYE